jgi:two-component system chemotaxis response regulator CheY
MGLRILVVDDALFMRNMLKDIFTRAGHEVIGEAANGVMPLRSGIEALQEITQEDPGACVVMCSALGQDALVVEAVQAGARDFIIKPFQEKRVLEVVDRISDKG